MGEMLPSEGFILGVAGKLREYPDCAMPLMRWVGMALAVRDLACFRTSSGTARSLRSSLIPDRTDISLDA